MPRIGEKNPELRCGHRETIDEKRMRARAIADRLADAYSEIKVPLQHNNVFELLIAVILSAQCTDEAVNKVTPQLFRRYPNAEKLAHAAAGDIEELIRALGLFRAKARSEAKRNAFPQARVAARFGINSRRRTR